MEEELQEIAKLWGSLEEIQNYRYHEGREKDSKNFQALKEGFEEVTDLNKLKIILLMLEEKRGTEITQKFDNRGSLEDFTEFLAEQGLYVWTGIGLEEDSFVYAEIFVNTASYPEDFFNRYQDLRDRRPKKYHRRIGEFFGYPEDSIEAFLSSPSLRERIRNFLARFTGLSMNRSGIVGLEEAVDEYGGDLARDEKRDIRTLIFYMPADNRESFDRALETAEARRESIENLEGEDFTGLQESHLKLLDSFGN